MNSRILLVEDSPDMQILIQAALRKKYQIKVVSTANEALAEIKAHTYSLVILDVELPDEDGFQICAKLRSEDHNKNLIIVFLTGKNKTNDKVMGFLLGADDYITKPIDPLEFSARIDSKMRRFQQMHETHDDFCKGIFRVNLSQQKIFLIKDNDEKDLDLSSIEFKLLYYFISHENHVLSREKILNEVWGQDSFVTDRSVDTHICTLRQKLDAFAHVISTVHGMGYRFSQNHIPSSESA